MRISIQHFSVIEFGLKPQVFCDQLKPVFGRLLPDFYDVKKRQIEILQTSPVQVSPTYMKQYYEGASDGRVLKPSYQALSARAKDEYDGLRPYRFRAISTFRVLFDSGEPKVMRCPTLPFSQDEALISENKIDVRRWKRVFPELSEEAASLPAFCMVLQGISRRIYSQMPSIHGLNIVAHHVKVQTVPGILTTNSPEGLHQDGFPLIVSALVVDRENISGGESQIYGEDKKTLLFRATLQPGNGLLQPDLGSPLWHTVTPIQGDGYRCSIGFDIDPITRAL